MTAGSFGPIVTLTRLPPLAADDAIVAAMNRCAFGLTGGVFTRDESRARDIMKRLECGTVYWNCCGAGERERKGREKKTRLSFCVCFLCQCVCLFCVCVRISLCLCRRLCVCASSGCRCGWGWGEQPVCVSVCVSVDDSLSVSVPHLVVCVAAGVWRCGWLVGSHGGAERALVGSQGLGRGHDSRRARHPPLLPAAQGTLLAVSPRSRDLTTEPKKNKSHAHFLTTHTE